MLRHSQLVARRQVEDVQQWTVRQAVEQLEGLLAALWLHGGVGFALNREQGSLVSPLRIPHAS